MRPSSLSSQRHLRGTVKPGMLDGIARKAVLGRLECANGILSVWTSANAMNALRRARVMPT